MLTAPFKSCWRLKLGLHGEVCLHLAKDKAFNSLSPTLATRYCEIRRSDEFFASFQGVTPFWMHFLLCLFRLRAHYLLGWQSDMALIFLDHIWYLDPRSG